VKFHRHLVAVCICAALLIASAKKSGAFALIGPFQPWMQATNGVMLPGDIGGPMSISNGYRLERSRGHLRLRPIIFWTSLVQMESQRWKAPLISSILCRRF